MKFAVLFLASCMAIAAHQTKYSDPFPYQMQNRYPFIPPWALEGYYRYLMSKYSLNIPGMNQNKGLVIDEVTYMP